MAAVRDLFDRLFQLERNRTTLGTELMAGLTTFMVMSYIIFVNPAILGQGGLPRPATTTATCLAAGVMSILMGLYTNRAYALAPGLGLNGIVAFQLIGQQGLSPAAAMGVIVLEGLLITLLVLLGVRRLVFDAVPLVLKQAIAVGIGWFILFIGLVNAGIVRRGEAVPVTMGSLTGVPVLVAVIGLAVSLLLMARRVRGALLWGIIVATVVAVILNRLKDYTAFPAPGVARLPERVAAAPDFSTFGHVSFAVFARLGVLTGVLTVVTIMLADFFDTMGTLIGVGKEAGYLDSEGRLPDVQKPLLVDSVAAAFGGLANASSVTTYIESAAGVSVGGRTGLVAVVTGLLFLLAMPLWPIVGVVPSEATAPALILVGYLMMTALSEAESTAEAEVGGSSARGINFADLETGLPAIATMVMMPLTFNITNGIGAGFVTYAAIKLFRGHWREVHPALWAVAALFVLYFLRESLFGLHF